MNGSLSLSVNLTDLQWWTFQSNTGDENSVYFDTSRTLLVGMNKIGNFDEGVKTLEAYSERLEQYLIILSQQRWRGYSNAAVRLWLGE